MTETNRELRLEPEYIFRDVLIRNCLVHQITGQGNLVFPHLDLSLEQRAGAARYFLQQRVEILAGLIESTPGILSGILSAPVTSLDVREKLDGVINALNVYKDSQTSYLETIR